uniref:NADH dehydrogenase subunit 4 n=1 Tax=Blasticotoma filiceti TaxID=1141352 RepID=UPI00220BB4D6|nr:NADH dehydrogenase subunit 4 [Blasticotoma filiceti]UXW93446.1 NADH dehydrogenase subunit 4 [Blasticotoma filiceti]
MLKFLFFFLFMIPLCFVSRIFWIFQVLFFGISGVFFILVGGSLSGGQCGGISYFFCWDILSFGLLLLTLWVGGLMIMASVKIYEIDYSVSKFLLMFIGLMLFLGLTFSSLNLFMFYFFFECSVIPVLFLILGWGNQSERVQASMYLFFYTLMASFPLMLGIFYLFESEGTLMYSLMGSCVNLDGFYLYLSLILAFLVKMPMFLVHLWLPKAHVEAPISGSMILAGVMLKLGGYGLLRLMSLINGGGVKYNFIWVSLSLIGGGVISLMCMFQVDLKSLVAYSSVVHMSLVLGGTMTLMKWGICGSYLMMISHGLCSSGLFCLLNIVYERLGSRSIFLNKGLINIFPSMTLWWFFLCSCNFAAPPSLSLLSEIMLINSLVSWSFVTMFILVIISFFSFVYTLYLYSFTQHGKFMSVFYIFYNNLREFMLVLLHWVPLNIMILNSELFVLWI